MTHSLQPSSPDIVKRTFLFLQGPSSPIFSLLADCLEKAGHHCLRINLNIGDRIFWRRAGGTQYRGRPSAWPAFLDAYLQRNRVTDIILLGEERPYHKAAATAAKRLGISVFVIEMGYLRPDWVTFERDGMSSNSHFPRHPRDVIQQAEGLPEPNWQRRYSQSFTTEAGYDLLYNLPNVFLWFLYPFYERHALFHPLMEYWGWVFRLMGAANRQRQASVTINRLLGSALPYFVYPLQLQTDYQLRAHSDFNGQEEAITKVITSFARNAAADARLVIKIHPLDNGLIDWRSVVREAAEEHGRTNSIEVIDGGNLELLYEKCAGVVTVNSTAALPAIRTGVPVKVLGRAIYDIEGMTAQASLDDFWQSPTPPDPILTSAFFRLLAHGYQVRGNFYSHAGASAAAEAIAARLLSQDSHRPS